MSGTAYFIFCLVLLFAGYAVYGKIAERIFGVDANRPTPVSMHADGVDYVKMPGWKIFFIQLLNIAGLGPVFGPLVGALYGPAALLWVVFGCIFAGAVHDFISGMISLRYGGVSYPEILGRNLGNGARNFMVVFTVLFMILVGAVFVTGPAAILASMTPLSLGIWSAIIFLYYIVATLMPIDKIIGRIYPFFSILLLFMAFSLLAVIFLNDTHSILPNLHFSDFFYSHHPKDLPIWPGLFIVIACGAISGFHATQSPMMARCMASEKDGRKFFYGSMIAEGVIGLIWVTLGLSFYESPEALAAAGPAPVVVKQISIELLGTFGGLLAILGVVILPISTGDTAFRSARLILADMWHIDQQSIFRRIMLSIPLFAAGIALTFIDFNIIWRYFGWMNQTLACITLWACSVYLKRRGRNFWITVLPAMFMTVVTFTFICNAKIGFNLSMTVSTIIGILVAIFFMRLFSRRVQRMPELND
ncbi:MAG: carbon starvation CstA family protein [Desulfovibrionaceae bacterium]|nr:carbon starvation CstA family protein [Desulfovibrionaceae bacterium]